MSGYVLIVLFAMLMACVWFGAVRDRYDQQRWLTDPLYCRYSAPLRDVARWWWRSKFRRR